MDILAIPGSAVPCERVFSSAKETTSPRRNRIHPDLMEALQMLKFSLRAGVTLNFTAGTSRKEEIEVLESNAADNRRLPDDITTYLNHLFKSDQFSDSSDCETDNFDG